MAGRSSVYRRRDSSKSELDGRGGRGSLSKRFLSSARQPSIHMLRGLLIQVTGLPSLSALVNAPSIRPSRRSRTVRRYLENSKCSVRIKLSRSSAGDWNDSGRDAVSCTYF
jgi:hypothetical protein